MEGRLLNITALYHFVAPTKGKQALHGIPKGTNKYHSVAQEDRHGANTQLNNGFW